MRDFITQGFIYFLCTLNEYIWNGIVYNSHKSFGIACGRLWSACLSNNNFTFILHSNQYSNKVVQGIFIDREQL